MYSNFVPTHLLPYADQLIADLKALNAKPSYCPYCQYNQFYLVHDHPKYYRCKACHKGFNRSLNTPFYRLTPIEDLPVIAIRRLCGQSLFMIREELNYSIAVVKNRIQAIDRYMQTVYPELFQWSQNFIYAPKNELPQIIIQQINELKTWINDQLNVTHANCPYCGSMKTNRITEKRAQFRCNQCWRYFSYLKGTGLEHLRHSDKWFLMIDLLARGKNVDEMQLDLGLCRTTIFKNRKIWLKIIQHQGLLVLHEWILGRKN